MTIPLISCIIIYRYCKSIYIYISIWKRENFMKLLIAGSRGITDFDLAPYIPDGTDKIISGGAKGIDTLAEQYAEQNGLKKIIIKPEYEKYGKAAPIKRNETMVELADAVLVIWDGKSKGTKYTIDYAKKLNKEITVIIV